MTLRPKRSRMIRASRPPPDTERYGGNRPRRLLQARNHIVRTPASSLRATHNDPITGHAARESPHTKEQACSTHVSIPPCAPANDNVAPRMRQRARSSPIPSAHRCRSDTRRWGAEHLACRRSTASEALVQRRSGRPPSARSFSSHLENPRASLNCRDRRQPLTATEQYAVIDDPFGPVSEKRPQRTGERPTVQGLPSLHSDRHDDHGHPKETN
jgi:hypothetical protein